MKHPDQNDRRHASNRWPAAVLSALLCSPLLAFADGDTLRDAEARYRADHAACVQGRSHQDRATCLKEAGAALAEARAAARRPAAQPREADYVAHALARCDRVPEPDRSDCRMMVQGHGSRDGSVAGGGILYQLVTKSVGAPERAASAP